MEKQTIIDVVEKHLIRSTDELETGQIELDRKFTDYGATSLDIVEIVSGAMRELMIRIPRTELSDIQNIGGLVDKFTEHAK